MSRKSDFRDKAKLLFSFSPSERRGILWILPMLAVIGIMIAYASKPSYENSFLKLADHAEQDSSALRPSYSGYSTKIAPQTTPSYTYGPKSEPSISHKPELFDFDPNTVTLQDLSRLGIDVRTAAGIIKYREKGKRFEIPEDFATCYGISMEMYTRLEPHIKIGERHKAKPKDFSSGKDENSSKISQASATSHTQPYIDGDSASQSNTKRSAREILELNRADSAQLRSVSGIGEVMVVRIIEYRKKLGGFAKIEQLSEIQGMTEQNYERICKQIKVDSCEIQKIDVNFAPHKVLVDLLGKHPYATDKMLRKILKARQMKGGWRSPGDMVKENIMTQKEAERLAPYLIFREE